MKSPHLKPYHFKPGQSGNPKGRPKGKTMKEFVREYLLNKTDEDKVKWLKKISRAEQWRMAEGNPANNVDLTTDGQPLYLPSETMRRYAINRTDTSPKEDSK